MEQNRQHFYELSLEYVCKLQEIQERKKFEFVEPVSIVEGGSAIRFLWYNRSVSSWIEFTIAGGHCAYMKHKDHKL